MNHNRKNVTVTADTIKTPPHGVTHMISCQLTQNNILCSRYKYGRGRCN